jgi:hypothetical protein
MPPPKKVDRLSPELRDWLRTALRERGFGDYEALSDELNRRLEDEGSELRIRKSALHEFGSAEKEFARIEARAGEWAARWLTEEGFESEARRHGVLFQMLTALAFKAMEAGLQSDEAPDPRELAHLGKMMKDLMQSSGMRERLSADLRAEQAKKLEAATKTGGKLAGLSQDTVEAIKAEILGIAA